MGEKIRVRYGLSMYGGWYAEFVKDEKRQFIHATNKYDLGMQLNEILNRGAWIFGARIDN